MFLRRGPILVRPQYAKLLERRILKWFLGFWKICGPIFYFIFSFISCSQTRNNDDNIKKWDLDRLKEKKEKKRKEKKRKEKKRKEKKRKEKKRKEKRRSFQEN